ncbi:MAG: MFS transporter [Alphaproteobacteria bacterium]|nr:MFS transporter [Alphaproteobacteria bacterium]MBU2271466.1 MFS transporter [Alphaproteobacteria bacterium]MBU2418484.1 MFS transporter [Alphaproteobacteria bacterium]
MTTDTADPRQRRPDGEAVVAPARIVGVGTVLLLAGVQFAAFVDRAMPSVVAQPLKDAFDLTDGQVGALQGPAFALTYAVAMLAAGHWARRVEPFRLMAFCLALWTAGSVAFALADSYPMLVGARMLLGIGQAAFAPAALVVLGSAGVAIGRARAVSIFTTGSATGRSGGLLLGGALLVAASGASIMGLAPWRAVSLALVLPNIALIAALLALSGRDGSSPPEPSSGLGQAAAWLCGNGRAVLGLFVAGAGCVISVQAAGTWMPSILHRSFGLPVGEAAVLVGLIVLVAAPTGHLSAGWLLGRQSMQGRSPALPMAAGLVLSMIAAVGLSAAASLPMAIAAMAVLVASSGMAATTALIGLQPLAPDRYRRAVNTLYLAGVSLVGVGLGPWITGALSDRSSASAGLTTSLVQLILAVGVFVLPLALLQGERWVSGSQDRGQRLRVDSVRRTAE